jgi:hypothetical protein
MPRLIRIAAVLAVLACSTPGLAPAQGPAIVRIATQSPLSGPGPGGEAIRLGPQLAIEQLGRPLGQMGLRVANRESVAAAVRRTKVQGVTGEIEFDGRGDRRKALYFVWQVAGEDPDQWRQNRVVEQILAPPRT